MFRITKRELSLSKRERKKLLLVGILSTATIYLATVTGLFDFLVSIGNVLIPDKEITGVKVSFLTAIFIFSILNNYVRDVIKD